MSNLTTWVKILEKKWKGWLKCCPNFYVIGHVLTIPCYIVVNLLCNNTHLSIICCAILSTYQVIHPLCNNLPPNDKSFSHGGKFLIVRHYEYVNNASVALLFRSFCLYVHLFFFRVFYIFLQIFVTLSHSSLLLVGGSGKIFTFFFGHNLHFLAWYKMVYK